MKTLYYAIAFLLLTSCAQKMYTISPDYSLSEVNGEVIKGHIFEDSLVKVQLIYSDKFYRIRLQNVSSENLFVEWDEMSFGRNGVVGNVVNKSSDWFNVNEQLKATAVPPGLEINDEIIPVNNILSRSDGSLYLKNLDKTYYSKYESHAKNYSNHKSVHNITLAIRQNSKTNYYNFKLNKVSVISQNEVPEESHLEIMGFHYMTMLLVTIISFVYFI